MSVENSLQQQFTFVEKITAGVTHDMNNVLAVINEYSGLLEDQIYLAENGAQLNLDKLQSISERLSNQVVRGRNLMKSLNKFAHETDQNVSAFDLNEMLENLILLCNRFALAQQIELKSNSTNSKIVIVHKAFALKQLVFNVLITLFEQINSPSEILVSSIPNGSQTKIVIELHPNSSTLSIDNFSIFDESAEKLSVLIEYHFSDADASIDLLLPNNFNNPQDL
ncbi:MAG: hypothetical protein PF588_04895 [Candidatus Kapabacteria bacterium]|jgi:signal transduction histidine kinase|nr:hypothetical protein [Candidatus Kapabacteria bacterium]